MDTRSTSSETELQTLLPQLKPSTALISELTRHNLNATNNEKTLTLFNATQESLGTASILSAVHMFIFYTALEQGGLGLFLGTVAGLAALGAVSFGTLLMTIPFSYFTYKKYTNETNKLISSIEKDEIVRQNHRETLFLDLLNLRKLFNEAKDFECILSELNLENDEIDLEKLSTLVNECYLPTTQLMQNLDNVVAFKNVQEDKKSEVAKPAALPKEPLPEKLHLCFKPIQSITSTNRSTAIMEGVYAGFSMLGATFSTATTFAGICITAGFCLALSATGWGILIAAVVLTSLIFGICMTIAKQQNLQREALQAHIEDRNHHLVTAKASVQSCINRIRLEKSEHKAQEQTKIALELNAKLEKQIEVNSRLEKELNVYKTQASSPYSPMLFNNNGTGKPLNDVAMPLNQGGNQVSVSITSTLSVSMASVAS